jgi:hypothetical protein
LAGSRVRRTDDDLVAVRESLSQVQACEVGTFPDTTCLLQGIGDSRTVRHSVQTGSFDQADHTDNDIGARSRALSGHRRDHTGRAGLYRNTFRSQYRHGRHRPCHRLISQHHHTGQHHSDDPDQPEYQRPATTRIQSRIPKALWHQPVSPTRSTVIEPSRCPHRSCLSGRRCEFVVVPVPFAVVRTRGAAAGVCLGCAQRLTARSCSLADRQPTQPLPYSLVLFVSWHGSDARPIPAWRTPADLGFRETCG